VQREPLGTPDSSPAFQRLVGRTDSARPVGRQKRLNAVGAI